jgi:hypothetical protein
MKSIKTNQHFLHQQTISRMSSLSGRMNIGWVNIEFFPGWKKIKQRRISFVLGYLRMILWKISTAIYLYGFLNQSLGLIYGSIFIRPSLDRPYYVIGGGGRPHRFPHNNFSSVYRIFTKLGHMIPLWKGKNPIYFGIIRSKFKVTITINRILDNRIVSAR